jgi:membrane-associated phospholipid phosphatase
LIWAIGLLLLAILLVASFWLDPSVRQWMVDHQGREWRIIMANISRYGNWYEHVILGFVLFAIAWWRGSKRWMRIFLAMLLACALAGAVGRVIKISAGRARPSVVTETRWNGPRLSEKYHAFPSGHTASSTAFFAVLFFASWRIGMACMVIPLLIAFSRMYVAAHYLSDVVFAAFLGALCAFAVARMMKLDRQRIAD